MKSRSSYGSVYLCNITYFLVVIQVKAEVDVLDDPQVLYPELDQQVQYLANADLSIMDHYTYPTHLTGWQRRAIHQLGGG